jgi:hypothetical protein
MVSFILIAAFSFWFAELSTIPQQIVIFFEIKRLRPFDCTKCLSFWSAIGYGLVYYEVHLVILYAGLTSLAGIILSRIYYKLLS